MNSISIQLLKDKYLRKLLHIKILLQHNMNASVFINLYFKAMNYRSSAKRTKK